MCYKNRSSRNFRSPPALNARPDPVNITALRPPQFVLRSHTTFSNSSPISICELVKKNHQSWYNITERAFNFEGSLKEIKAISFLSPMRSSNTFGGVDCEKFLASIVRPKKKREKALGIRIFRTPERMWKQPPLLRACMRRPTRHPDNFEFAGQRAQETKMAVNADFELSHGEIN